MTTIAAPAFEDSSFRMILSIRGNVMFSTVVAWAVRECIGFSRQLWSGKDLQKFGSAEREYSDALETIASVLERKPECVCDVDRTSCC